MAEISIDTVYQKVLAIASKEQRGYITPQEFNLFANHAQMDIFEQYFYDTNQFKRVPGNNEDYSDILSVLDEKTAPFEKNHVDMSAVSGMTATLPTDVYRLGTVFYNNGSNSIKVERVEPSEIELMNQTALYAPSAARPVYVRKNATQILLYPTSSSPAYSTSTLNCHYIAKPATVKWTYTVSGTYKALYNASASDLQNFELHLSEETNLVIKILQLAGVSMKDQFLTQVALQEEMKNIQLEKQ